MDPALRGTTAAQRTRLCSCPTSSQPHVLEGPPCAARKPADQPRSAAQAARARASAWPCGLCAGRPCPKHGPWQGVDTLVTASQRVQSHSEGHALWGKGGRRARARLDGLPEVARVGRVLERIRADQHDIQRHAAAPHVRDLAVVLLPRQHLRPARARELRAPLPSGKNMCPQQHLPQPRPARSGPRSLSVSTHGRAGSSAARGGHTCARWAHSQHVRSVQVR